MKKGALNHELLDSCAFLNLGCNSYYSNNKGDKLLLILVRYFRVNL